MTVDNCGDTGARLLVSGPSYFIYNLEPPRIHRSFYEIHGRTRHRAVASFHTCGRAAFLCYGYETRLVASELSEHADDPPKSSRAASC